MGFFSFGSKRDRYGIIVDVGSGSVLTALVHSESGKKHPTIVWAHREHIALKKIDSVQHSAKAVLAALMNAGLKLDGEGRKELRNYAPEAKPEVTQCTISAPWSYTVTKTVNVNQDEPLVVTETFVRELIDMAQRQVQEELQSHAGVRDANLSVIVKATMEMLTNGYRVADPEGERVSNLNLTHATVVSQDYIIEGIKEVQEKLFSAAEIKPMSFILMFYCTVRSLHPEIDDVCLVDVTDEATEIGVVRDGSLKYSTHTPFGMFSLAREIAEVCNLPLTEALGHLRAADVAGVSKFLPESKTKDISDIFDSYIQKIAKLLNETGDSLSIPKRVLLHIEASHNPLFASLIKRAAYAATKINHEIISVANEIITPKQQIKLAERVGDYQNDTALILNAEFFHKQKHCLDFNYS